MNHPRSGPWPGAWRHFNGNHHGYPYCHTQISTSLPSIFDVDDVARKQGAMVALYAWQGGRCALCGGDVPLEFTVADHCHKDGEVGGLLCTGCNALDGHGPDAADCLDRGEALRRYRAHPPMRMLGLRCQYSDCQGWRRWCANYDAQQMDLWRAALSAQEYRGADSLIRRRD